MLSDFDYELRMSLVNRKLSGIEASGAAAAASCATTTTPAAASPAAIITRFCCFLLSVCAGLQTLFLMADERHTHISSTLIRELGRWKTTLPEFV